MNPSVNGYECVRGRLLIRPDTPVNLSEKNYINVQKHHPTLLAVNKLRNGLLYTPFTLCLYILKIINLNSDRYIGFVLGNIWEGDDGFMKDETRTLLQHAYKYARESWLRNAGVKHGQFYNTS